MRNSNCRFGGSRDTYLTMDLIDIDKQDEIEDDTARGIRVAREALVFTQRIFSITRGGSLTDATLAERQALLLEAVEKSACLVHTHLFAQTFAAPLQAAQHLDPREGDIQRKPP